MSLSRPVSEMEATHIHIPIVAIGGITEEDIPDILQTGVTGIALSGTVLRADDPVQKMKQLINTVNHE